MITTAEEFLEMVTVHKDRELGQWDREYIHGMLIHVMETIAKMPFPQGRMEELLDAIEANISEELLEKTNVTVHFTIQALAMSQYLTPYTKRYAVGKTRNGIEEKVIWKFRPEFIKEGYINEITEQVGHNRSLRENNTHEFGSCEDYFNIVALHTYEYDKTKNADASDIHIAVLVPCGSLIRDISRLGQARKKDNEHMINLLKEGHQLEAKRGSKKNSTILGRSV